MMEPLSHHLSEPQRAGTSRRAIVSRLTGVARRSPIGVVSCALLLIMVIAAVLAPQVTPYGPLELHRVDRLQSPNLRYWLGTDSFGRDQFSRIVYGARISLWVGVAPIAISLVVGGFTGVISGLFGGWLDAAIQRVVDALMAFPALLLVLVIVALLGPSETNIVLVLALVTIPAISRVARGATLVVATQPYVLSARAVGATNWRIAMVHVVPNVFAPVLVVGASLIGTAILAEASLSFLGLGIPPPAPSWGNLLGGENRDLFEAAPWLAIFPGLAITITVLLFNLLGDALRDELDPRTRGRAG